MVTQTPVTKKLTRHGNSLALVIDKPILELLKIDAHTPLSMTTDGRCLVITPAHDPRRRRRFQAALRAVNREWGDVLKRLAE